MQGLARAGINNFCHMKLWTFIFVFGTWTEHIATIRGESGSWELDKIVGCAGEVDTVECIFSSLVSGKLGR